VEGDLKALGRKTATTCSGCRRSQWCTSWCAAATRPWPFGVLRTGVWPRL